MRRYKYINPNLVPDYVPEASTDGPDLVLARYCSLFLILELLRIEALDIQNANVLCEIAECCRKSTDKPVEGLACCETYIVYPVTDGSGPLFEGWVTSFLLRSG